MTYNPSSQFTCGIELRDLSVTLALTLHSGFICIQMFIHSWLLHRMQFSALWGMG